MRETLGTMAGQPAWPHHAGRHGPGVLLLVRRPDPPMTPIERDVAVDAR